ncbi:MAG TPA: glycosyltransferase 87 family protein [Candidatus Acidoferrum sp.]|nr:glycosyltransferase 87 family protein [Candidatus Acidoferrum sp.]
MTRRTAGLVVLLAIIGWTGLAWLAIQLYSTNPRQAGFDLELLLKAGRDVANGRSPYDPAMLAGSAPVAERLFYSYPPFVAQVMSLFASIPSPVMFVAWTAAAVAGLALLARSIAARYAASATASVVALVAVAVSPLIFPFAIGLVFGNLDVFFPLLFGLVLLGNLPPPRAAASAGSGIAATIAAVAKLHPGSLGLWLLARSKTATAARRAVVAALGALIVVVGLSLFVGGVQPWIDYATVVRAGSGADLVDPRNAGPAAQVALLVGGGGSGAEMLARTLQIPVTIAALLATIVVALRVNDPVESLAWAAVASLVVLPVTWYHYPSALIPFAIVAVLRARTEGPRAAQALGLVVAAAVVAAVGIAWLPLIYVAIGLVIAAVRISGREASPSRVESPAAAIPASGVPA